MWYERYDAPTKTADMKSVGLTSVAARVARSRCSEKHDPACKRVFNYAVVGVLHFSRTALFTIFYQTM